MKTTRVVSIFLTIFLMANLFSFSAFGTYAPDPIPEEEQSAVASDYYDETDKEISEKIKIIQETANATDSQTNPTDSIAQYRAALSEYEGVNTLSTRSSYASYNRTNAAAYAQAYALNPNDTYKKLDADCTNFVSQAIAVGGVYSYINSSFTSVPSVLKDWIMDTNSNSWYMIKKTRSIGYDYWVYSKTWAFVDNFRTFHTARSASGSNHFSGYVPTNSPNTTENENTNFEYKLRKNAKVGQVWQAEGHHSIIITKVVYRTGGYNYVWYSCHSDNVLNGDIQNFFNWVNKSGSSGGNGAKVHCLDFS
ncbi:MAG: amidase domain-containing protein [Clostridiales bacterium]|nr:amidase domain-containing protein [Clostridiales bacterium]